MDSFLLIVGFTRCHFDPNIYILQMDDTLTFLFLYVDDLLIIGSHSSTIKVVKTALHDRFMMSDLGLLYYFLGIEITQSSSEIFLGQPKYALDMLSKFRMADCKPAPTPFLSGVKLEAKFSSPLVDSTFYRQIVRRLIYLTHTRPDISYAVGMVSRFMQEPHELYWKEAKQILHYIQGTHNYRIQYAAGMDIDLVGYTDSDQAGDSQDHKSTLGYRFSLGSGSVCWSSKKQSAISLSSTEAEYRGAVNATTEDIWIQNILTEFGIPVRKPTIIFCDNQSAIQISRNPVHHQRTKHIEIHMNCIWELIQEGIIDLKYCSTMEHTTNIFTKPFTESKFLHL